VVRVRLENDLDRPVVIRQCDLDCSQKLHDKHLLLPEESVVVNSSARGVHNWWLILDEDGKKIGCVDLLFYSPNRNAERDLSSFSTCPPRSNKPYWLNQVEAFLFVTVFLIALPCGLVTCGFFAVRWVIRTIRS
jgi:hypothetical protein